MHHRFTTTASRLGILRNLLLPYYVPQQDLCLPAVQATCAAQRQKNTHTHTFIGRPLGTHVNLVTLSLSHRIRSSYYDVTHTIAIPPSHTEPWTASLIIREDLREPEQENMEQNTPPSIPPHLN